MMYKNFQNTRKITTVSLVFMCVFAQFGIAQTDVWFDKNEDENYTARHECSFVQAGDKFIMFGGRENAQQLDIYDYKTNTWSIGKNAPKEFNHFQAIFYKGFVWVIGSFKTNKFPREIPEDNIWLYHPPTDKWIQGPEIPVNRRRGGAGLVIYKDKFYLIGGNTIGHDGGYVNWFDEYDPKANTWSILKNASQARDHFSAAVINDMLYAVAGRHSGGEGGVFAPLISTVDIYDFKKKKWSTLKRDLPTPRAAPGVAVLNEELLVMGGEGENAGPAYNIVEAYNTKTKTWSRKADMNYPRHGTQAIKSGEGIYIAAGSPNRGGGRQKNMEVYGNDKPEGIALIGSQLIAPDKIYIKTGTNKKINVKNGNGNTGSFITSVKIKESENNQFKLLSSINFILVDAYDTINIEILHQGDSKGDSATVSIIYNGDIEKTFQIISE